MLSYFSPEASLRDGVRRLLSKGEGYTPQISQSYNNAGETDASIRQFCLAAGCPWEKFGCNLTAIKIGAAQGFLLALRSVLGELYAERADSGPWSCWA